MTDEILCPQCGFPNPADAGRCQRCQAELKPLSEQPGKGSTESNPEKWLEGLFRQPVAMVGEALGEDPSDPAKNPEINPEDKPAEKQTLSHPVDNGEESFSNNVPEWLAHIRQRQREDRSFDEENEEPPAEELENEQPEPSAEEDAETEAEENHEEEEDWLTRIRRRNEEAMRDGQDEDAVLSPEARFYFQPAGKLETTASPREEDAETGLPVAPPPGSGSLSRGEAGDEISSVEEVPGAAQPPLNTQPPGEEEPSAATPEESEFMQWLRSLEEKGAAGEAAPSSSMEEIEISEERMAELDSEEGGPAESVMPDWLSNLLEKDSGPSGVQNSPREEDHSQITAGAAEPESRPGGQEEIPGWLRKDGFIKPPASTSPNVGDEYPAWLAHPAAESLSGQTVDESLVPPAPDWVTLYANPIEPGQPEAAPTPEEEDETSLLNRLAGIPGLEEPPAAEPGQPEAAVTSESTEEEDETSLLNRLAGIPGPEEPPAAEPGQPEAAVTSESTEEEDEASLLNRLAGIPGLEEPPAAEPGQPEAAVTSDSTEEKEKFFEPAFEEEYADQPESAGFVDWFEQLKQSDPDELKISPPPPVQGPILPKKQAPEILDYIPAEISPVEGEAETINDENPEEEAEGESPESSAPGAESVEWFTPPPEPLGKPEPPLEAEGEKILPADIPGWVEALRPVESLLENSAESIDDKAIETSGPLAGLAGILPSENLAAGIRRPPAYSNQLQISDRQRAQTGILENMIAGAAKTFPTRKTRPAPMPWLIRLGVTLLLFAATLIPMLLSPSASASPSFETNASLAAFNNLVESIPQGSTALVVFDYDPGYAGEMRFAAKGLLQQLLQRQVRLAVISTIPAGPVLAEEFIQSLSAELNAVGSPSSGLPDENRVNLGYLPGGLSSLQELALDPRGAALAGFDQNIKKENLWDHTAIKNIHRLSDFSAVIVLTGSVDTGRAWVEQTSSTLGDTPFLMVASAQAAPILRLYTASGQVDGLLSGLQDGMSYERLAKAPGNAEAYWNSFRYGMLAMVILLLVGLLIGAAGSIFSRRKAAR